MLSKFLYSLTLCFTQWTWLFTSWAVLSQNKSSHINPWTHNFFFLFSHARSSRPIQFNNRQHSWEREGKRKHSPSWFSIKERSVARSTEKQCTLGETAEIRFNVFLVVRLIIWFLSSISFPPTMFGLILKASTFRSTHGNAQKRSAECFS